MSVTPASLARIQNPSQAATTYLAYVGFVISKSYKNSGSLKFYSQIMRLITALPLLAICLRTTEGAFLKREPAVVPLAKRDATTALTDSVWTTTTGTTTTTFTPYAIDGVTVDASPVTSSATAWVSLDSSGIPYAVTPTVSDSSTTSASPTPTNTAYPTPLAAPPVLRCMNERVPSSSDPLCIANATSFVAGETYWITWNPLYWNPDNDDDGISKVQIRLRAYSEDTNSSAFYTTDYSPNSDGYIALTIDSDWIDEGNDGWVQIVLTPFLDDDDLSSKYSSYEGPAVKLVSSQGSIERVPSDNGSSSSSSSTSTTSSSTSTSTSTSSSSSHKSKASVIAPAVVVPVVVVGLVGGLVAYIFMARNRKKVKEQNKTANENLPMESLPRGKEDDHNYDGRSLRTEATGTNPFD
ncbi:hypothetical protein KL909_003711 [Ogataea angusta]|nr:hypothetical protein KL909_003711 [Ogataea angusta]